MARLAPRRLSPRKHKSAQAADMKYLRRSPRNNLSTRSQDVKHLRRSPRNHMSSRAGIVKPLRRRAQSKSIKPQRPSPERTSDGRPSIASPRVFAIPELLEHILIQVLEHAQPKIYQIEQLLHHQNEENTTIRHISDYSELAHAKEVRALFRLQRVNKAFEATINGSKALRKAMFLEHSHDGKDRDLLQYDPLIFQLSPIKAAQGDIETKIFGGLEEGLRYRCRYNYNKPDVEGAFPAQGQAVVSEIQHRARNTNGSWWRTLVSNMPSHIYFSVRVDFEDWPDWKERRHLLEKDATLWQLMWRFVDGVEERHAHRVPRSRRLGRR